MPVQRMLTLEEADAFMAAPKRIVNPTYQGQWAPDTRLKDELVMKWPLEIGGQILPGALFAITSNPHRQDMLFFRLHVFAPTALSRLDHTDDTHENTLSCFEYGLPFIVDGPHFHRWDFNRRFYRPPHVNELQHAEPFTVQIRTLDAGLRWFCAQNNIEPLPPNHVVELAPREKLL